MFKMMSGVPREKVTLIKSDRTMIENIDALVTNSSALIEDADIQIEEGDYFLRILPNGLNEYYEVIDNGYFGGSGGRIPPHYQVKLKKVKELPITESKGEENMKKPMIFISHASADIKYVQPFIDLLADIGLDNTNLFCSSVPDYGIPLGNDIFDYLASLFNEYELHVIFMLSENYYDSKPCLNEMGAAWVLKNDYTSILLPKFEYSDIKGAVNPNKIGLKYDDNEELLKLRLGQLKEIIIKKIGKTVPDMRWEKKRNEFITTINSLIAEGD